MMKNQTLTANLCKHVQHLVMRTAISKKNIFFSTCQRIMISFPENKLALRLELRKEKWLITLDRTFPSITIF